jgi:predicted nuclease of predicted toxin-antitoxin system
MRLKLDENFGKRAAGILSAAGHDVETVPAEDLCRASDRELARVCRAEERCLVTSTSTLAIRLCSGLLTTLASWWFGSAGGPRPWISNVH